MRRFFDSYDKVVEGLIQRYLLDSDDAPWIATHKLKEKGIDVEAWCTEVEASRK